MRLGLYVGAHIGGHSFEVLVRSLHMQGRVAVFELPG